MKIKQKRKVKIWMYELCDIDYSRWSFVTMGQHWSITISSNRGSFIYIQIERFRENWTKDRLKQSNSY